MSKEKSQNQPMQIWKFRLIFIELQVFIWQIFFKAFLYFEYERKSKFSDRRQNVWIIIYFELNNPFFIDRNKSLNIDSLIMLKVAQNGFVLLRSSLISIDLIHIHQNIPKNKKNLLQLFEFLETQNWLYLQNKSITSISITAIYHKIIWFLWTNCQLHRLFYLTTVTA